MFTALQLIQTHSIRVEFTKEHDNYLVKYLATYCPSRDGRRGQKIFQRLVDNEQNRWPWSVHHTWQSWRERYVKHTEHFDALIVIYQKKHKSKRKRDGEPVSIEMLAPNAKRVRLEEEEEEEEEEGPMRHA
ncbi:hypothetical protein OG21DRAFT_803843 [Imleria badia]|nr:hypothetical protein OG21DRAFT_803843 [Imleria badia]